MAKVVRTFAILLCASLYYFHTRLVLCQAAVSHRSKISRSAGLQCGRSPIRGVGDDVRLSTNCSGPRPTIIIYHLRPLLSILDDSIGPVYVHYSCGMPNSSMPEISGVLFPCQLNLNGSMETVNANLSDGSECTFSGSYIVGFTEEYFLRQTTCTVNIDDCQQNVHNCSESQECVDIVGGYECRCAGGYEDNGFNCTNIDECSEGHNCSASADCVDNDGSYTCICKNGYDGDGFICTDVDECSEQLHNCSDNGMCYNTDGGYNCTCNDGYSLAEDGLNCTDDDECLRENNCTRCINTDGGYQCECTAGYQSAGLHCIDVDECSEQLHNCSDNGMCYNTVGGYNCTCNDGYSLAEDGFNCTDDDECFRENNCTRCTNTDGGYQCECTAGYQSAGLHCIDVDECSEQLHNCSDNGMCYNTDGGYNCTCNDGYSLAADGLNCTESEEHPSLDLLWLFVGIPVLIALTAIASALVTSCCVLNRVRRNATMYNFNKDYQMFFKTNEVDLNFSPVSITAERYVTLSPSLRSIFEPLEKANISEASEEMDEEVESISNTSRLSHTQEYPPIVLTPTDVDQEGCMSPSRATSHLSVPDLPPETTMSEDEGSILGPNERCCDPDDCSDAGLPVEGKVWSQHSHFLTISPHVNTSSSDSSYISIAELSENTEQRTNLTNIDDQYSDSTLAQLQSPHDFQLLYTWPAESHTAVEPTTITATIPYDHYQNMSNGYVVRSHTDSELQRAHSWSGSELSIPMSPADSVGFMDTDTLPTARPWNNAFEDIEFDTSGVHTDDYVDFHAGLQGFPALRGQVHMYD